MTDVTEGTAAPDFSLPTAEGPVTLADFAGAAMERCRWEDHKRI